jgi:mannitol/fructose-specific phosphotransferase system IIA component
VGFHKYVSVIVGEGIRIPHGLSLPVSIAYTESRGTGRAHVYGKTTAQMFPNKTVVIPAGTEVEGDATLTGGSWTIHWNEVNVRGVHAEISATNNESLGNLRGRNVILNVR